MLHCLCLLNLTLQKEVMFMDLLRESQASMLVSPLEQLLQGVSPQTRRADHIVNIARCLLLASVKRCALCRLPTVHPVRTDFLTLLLSLFVPPRYLCHSSSNPDAAFQSAKILRRIANHPNIHSRLVGDFTHDQVRKSRVKNCALHTAKYLLRKFTSAL